MADDPFRAQREADVIDVPRYGYSVIVTLEPLPGFVLGGDCTIQLTFLRPETLKESN